MTSYRIPGQAVILALSALAFGSQLVGQTPAPATPTGATPVRRVPIGTGTISGVVTAAETGRPVGNARVSLTGGASGPTGRSDALSNPLVPPGALSAGRGGTPAMIPSVYGFYMQVSRTALTDAQGQFVFQRLPPGQFNLNVSRTQYLATSYGQNKPGQPGTSIVLADGQQVKVAIPMIRGGVITGTVTGDNGEPLSSVQVRALRFSMTSGVRRLQSTAYATTDDRGIYRLFGLQPGEYVVAAQPQNSDLMMARQVIAEAAAFDRALASGVQPAAGPGQPQTITLPVAASGQPADPPPGYLPTYHPSAAMPANAATITINGGDERGGVDVQMQFVEASVVQGTVMNPASQTTVVQVSLQNHDSTGEQGTSSTRLQNPDGRFTFQTVAPGTYTVLAQTVLPQLGPRGGGTPGMPPGPPPRLSPEETLWGRADVTVEGQSTVNVSISLQPGRAISGMVVFDAVKPPDLAQARVTVSLANPPFTSMPVFGPPAQAPVGPDGRFTLGGVIPGKYILRASWGVQKSVVIGGDDVLDFPLDFDGGRDITDAVITVTDRANEVSGLLTDVSGKPALDYTVVLASRDNRYWTAGGRRILTARPGPDGRYTFRNVPAGGYFLGAVTDLEQGGQYDPEFLKSLMGASMTVTVNEGEKQAQDLRLAK